MIDALASVLPFLPFLGIFVGSLLIYEALRQVLSRSESRGEARNRRMRLVAAGTSTAERLNLLKPASSGRWPAGLPLIGTLPADLRRAGRTTAPVTFLTLCLLAVAAFSLAGDYLVPLPLAMLVGVTLGLALPLVILQARGRRRLALLTRQLPDALDLMSRGLRVGHPLNATIAAVAREMPDPVAMEFGIITDQVSYGDNLPDAFDDMARRIGTEDIRYLAVSIAIQHGTGGDLAAVLNTLARVIRDRISMRKRIRAISAEGRLSAWFLSCLPVAIIGFTGIMAPTYYGDVTGDPAFRPLAITVLALIVANALALRKLVNFRI